MNKIFKVIWSKARGCYVVASEFAKSHTKSGRAAKAAAVAVAAALTLGMNGLALVADAATSTGDGVAYGNNSNALKSTDTAVGNNAQALGTEYEGLNKSGNKVTYSGHTTAIGSDTKAEYYGSTALGSGAQALGEEYTVTIGQKTYVYRGASTAIGQGSLAKMYASTAVGAYAQASARHSTALGFESIASGVDSISLGYSSEATGSNSVALGHDAVASGSNSTTVGFSSTASGEESTAVGFSAQAIGSNSTALGHEADAQAQNSTALGFDTTASGTASTAVGKSAQATSGNSTALGHSAIASGSNSISLGFSSEARGSSSMAVGYDAEAYGNGSEALGHKAIAGVSGSSYSYALAVGDRANATADYSLALGFTSRATGDDSIAQGRRAAALDDNTIAVGYNAQAGSGTVTWSDDGYSSSIRNSSSTDAQYATAIGYSAKAYSKDSLALGHLASVRESAEKATAVGYNAGVSENATGATVYGSNAKGYDEYATAIGYGAEAGAGGSVVKVNATAVGYKAKASGDSSIAVGDQAKSYGESTIAIGTGAEAGVSGMIYGYYTVAVGDNAKAKAVDSLALGHSAEVERTATNATVLGSGAHAYGANNVVLGAGSSDAVATSSGSNTVTVGGYGFGETNYSGDEYVFTTSDGDPTSLKVKVSEFAGIGSGVVGTVSVGSDGQTRTLTNVAAGRITEDSTDAINGSQLYNVIDSLPEQKHTVNGKYKDSSKGETADAPVVNSGEYVGGNLLIKADEDATTGDITYDISLNNKLDLGGSGSVTMGDTTVNYEGVTINNGPSITNVGINAGNQKIINVANGVNDYDAVNMSQLTKVETLAGKHTQVTVEGGTKAGKDTDSEKNVYAGKNLQLHVTEDDDGQLTYDLKLNNQLDLGEQGSVTMGNTIINNNGLVIGGATVGDTKYENIVIKQGDVNFGGNKIVNVVTDGEIGSSVVNVDYLETYITQNVNDTDKHIEAGDHWVGEIDNGVSMNIVDQKGNVTGTVTINDVAKASDVGDITKFDKDVLNKDGSKTTVVDAINNIDNRVDVIEGDVNKIKTDITNIEKVAGAHTEVTVDGVAPAKGGDYVGGNLQLKVTEGNDGQDIYDIKMKDNLDLTDKGSVTIGDTKIDNSSVNIGSTTITENKFDMGDTHITNNSVTTTEVTTGNTTVNNNGLTVKGDTEEKNITINQNNVSMGGNQIHNVAAGTADTDAVNYSQLKQVEQNVTNNSVQINKLGSRIDKVGAGAAALAALHPLDFDPDDKFYLSAGYGNYRGENAVAVGAFYQPNDDTLFSVSSTVGNDDDMINAGVTWRFGQSSNQSRSKKAMAKEIIELRTEVAELKAMVYSLTGYGMNMEKSKLFPDTPENHWAYDYVAVVAGNGILEGYPDGYFDGERPMTRYEMAAVVYRLLQKGVQVDNRMVQEFAPELARVRVDTLTHYSDGTPNIQRVRVIEGRG